MVAFHVHKNTRHLARKSNQPKRPRGRPKNDREHYMFKLKPEVSDLLWRLKDIEGMSRSEIVEGAIIRLARRRCIDQSVQDTQRKRITLTAVLDLRAKISGCQGIFS